MKITQAIAEIAGAFAADGCLQKQYLCMWGNISEDKDYYDTCLCKLYHEAFGTSLRPHPKQSNSVYGFYLCDKKIVTFFNNVLHFPIGSKTYSVNVPPLIFETPELHPAFIRGFADGDGCITFSKRKGTYSFFKRTRHTYPRIMLSSVSPTKLLQIKTMLDSLEIHNTLLRKKLRIKQTAPINVITIRGTTALRKWMQIVGFSNPVHQTKVRIWEKFGFCPTKTSLKQRKEVLCGKLPIETFYNNL